MAATAAKLACPAAWKGGWQRLADRIQAPVYCPSWLPNPLTGVLSGPWNNINSVDKRDDSYLMGFVWQEQGQEVHVNLRGYPGRTAIPTCRSVELVAGQRQEKRVPCFSRARGAKRAPGIAATMYAVNQDADESHVLYAWRHEGSLYTISEHVAPPLTHAQVVRNLDRMLRSLVLVRPGSAGQD